MSAYSTPEKTAAFMQHIEINFDRIMTLRKAMKQQGSSMASKVLAFSELHSLMHGDPHAQRRLAVELMIEAQKELNLFKAH
jgi:hypothetical protein